MDEDFSPNPEDRKKWQRTFFYSLCALGFLVGLMFGRLFKTEAIEPTRLVELQQHSNGLYLCFEQEPRYEAMLDGGNYLITFEQLQAEPQRGSFLLSERQVNWRLEQHSKGSEARLWFVSLQQLKPRLLAKGKCVQIDFASEQGE